MELWPSHLARGRHPARIGGFCRRFYGDDAIVVAAAADIAPATALEGTANLISKSLLSADFWQASPHFRLLDSTRAFVAEQLRDDPKHHQHSRAMPSLCLFVA